LLIYHERLIEPLKGLLGKNAVMRDALDLQEAAVGHDASCPL
jgi:hypothetical protein